MNTIKLGLVSGLFMLGMFGVTNASAGSTTVEPAPQPIPMSGDCTAAQNDACSVRCEHEGCHLELCTLVNNEPQCSCQECGE